MAFLEVKNLSFRYLNSRNMALENISFKLEEGETLLVCGLSGSGKSTLLRCLKPSAAPFAEKRTGNIFIMGKDAGSLSQREQASLIGFVMQNPDNQIVTHKVWHEMAFTMENIGVPPEEMRLRVGEMCSYFGLGDLYERDVNTLSGGQKQLVSLASVLAADPSLIILDEPSSQLDPVSSEDFLSMIKRINREMGITVIISEHQLEKAMTFAQKLLVLENGKQLFYGGIREGIASVCQKSPGLFKSMPQGVKLYNLLSGQKDYPMDVCQSRVFLKSFIAKAKGEKAEEEAQAKRSAAQSGTANAQIKGMEDTYASETVQDTEKAQRAEESGLFSPETSSSERRNSAYSYNLYREPERDGSASAEDKKIPALRAEELWFRYEKAGRDVIKGLSFQVQKGEIFSLLGANGSGKSTLLKCICGLEKPVRGRVSFFQERGSSEMLSKLFCREKNRKASEDSGINGTFENKEGRKSGERGRPCAALLPQNPAMLFLREKVYLELKGFAGKNPLQDEKEIKEIKEKKEKKVKNKKEEIERRIAEVIDFFQLEKLLDMHPYDLSGGEQQRLGLAMLMLKDPDIILLDEPTKGIDFSFKEKLAATLQRLALSGKTIVIATHDVEFAAGCSHRCGMLFNGSLLSQGTPREFFSGNRFYTTEVSRITRDIIPQAVFLEDVLSLLKKERLLEEKTV